MNTLRRRVRTLMTIARPTHDCLEVRSDSLTARDQVPPTLFLGGGALPYVSGISMIEGIGAYFGTGLATLLCMAIHTSVFFAKVVMVVALMGPLGRRIKGLTFATSLNLCWKLVVPLSMLNLFVTAHFLLAVEISQ